MPTLKPIPIKPPAAGRKATLVFTPELLRKLRAALAEDVGSGDVTTERCVPAREPGRGEIIAKGAGVLCGTAIADRVWEMVDRRISVTWLARDGQRVAPGQRIARLEGPMRGLLTGERLALNFLQQLSGVSTLTAAFRDAAGGSSGPCICDIRKTTPLWRGLERYAVATGGGVNHRFGLFDMVLIKENHARAAGGLREAIRASRVVPSARAAGSKSKHPALRIAAEASTLAEVRICCEEHVDLILLDNFSPAGARRAVELCRPSGIPTEISGGINLRNIAAYARAGADRVSIGALTHSAPALDISVQLYLTGQTSVK